MNNHLRMRNQRLGLECSTSPLAHATHTGFLESIILTAVTNSAVFSLGPAAVSLVSSGLTALATTAISLGINYLLSPKPPKPADGKVPREQPMPPVIFGVGTNRIAGAAMLKEEKDNYYYLIRAIAGHRIHQFKKHWLHDDIVVLNGSDMVDRSAVTGDDQWRYGKNSDLVKMQYRVGLPTETAYPDAVAAFAAEDIWTNDHRGDGTASAFMRCNAVSAKSFASTYPYGAPQPSDEVDMALVWDFRDPGQSPDDQSTWAFSKNAALCYAWWLCFCPYGPRRDYRQALLPYLDRWKVEADICDEDVPIAGGGTEKRYEVNTWATTETDPIAIQNTMLSACDGHIAQYGSGGLMLTVGKFREELVGELTDADIVGHTVHNDVLEEDEINRLVPRFVYPATEYTAAVTDYFESTADQADVGQVLSEEADYQGVHQWRQARRLGKREWQRLQQKKSGTLDCRMSGINEVVKRWVRLNTPIRLPALNGKIIEIKRAFLALKNGGFQIEWALHPNNIEDWNPDTDEGAAPPVPTKPNSKGVPAAVIISVTAIGNGSSVFLRVVVGDPLDNTVTPVVRYRIKTTGQWVEQQFPTAVLSGGAYTLDTATVQSNETFEVEAAFIGSRGTYGEWYIPPVEIVAAVDPVAPVALLSFSGTGGTAKFTANFATANDLHLATVAIFRVPSGGAISPRPTPVSQPAVSPGISYAIPVSTPVGTWDVYAEPRNRSGLAGPISGPSTVTVS